LAADSLPSDHSRVAVHPLVWRLPLLASSGVAAGRSNHGFRSTLVEVHISLTLLPHPNGGRSGGGGGSGGGGSGASQGAQCVALGRTFSVLVEVTNLGPRPLRGLVLSVPNTLAPAAAAAAALQSSDAAKTAAPPPITRGGHGAATGVVATELAGATGLAAVRSGDELAVVALDGTVVLAASGGGSGGSGGGSDVLVPGAVGRGVVRYVPLASGLVALAPLGLAGWVLAATATAAAATHRAEDRGGDGGGGDRAVGADGRAPATALSFTTAAFPLEVLVR
jgi:hypothetical protein